MKDISTSSGTQISEKELKILSNSFSLCAKLDTMILDGKNSFLP
jgi:hypothetical protein